MDTDSNKPTTLTSEFQTPYVNSKVSSANEEEEMEDVSQTGVWFKIECIDKTHRFHTSSLYSARHWCNCISKGISELSNTNSLREATIKIPSSGILEHRQKVGLAGSGSMQEPHAQQEETPTTFSVKFKVPGESIELSLRRGFKRKNSKVKHLLRLCAFHCIATGK